MPVPQRASLHQAAIGIELDSPAWAAAPASRRRWSKRGTLPGPDSGSAPAGGFREGVVHNPLARSVSLYQGRSRRFRNWHRWRHNWRCHSTSASWGKSRRDFRKKTWRPAGPLRSSTRDMRPGAGSAGWRETAVPCTAESFAVRAPALLHALLELSQHDEGAPSTEQNSSA